MKKLIFSVIILLLSSAAFADGDPTLSLHISEPVKNNKYFLCVYDVGCLSIKASNAGKTYPISNMDVGNIINFVITDIDTMQEFTVPSNASCHVNVQDGQKLSITGRLVVNNGKPDIQGLKCHLA